MFVRSGLQRLLMPVRLRRLHPTVKKINAQQTNSDVGDINDDPVEHGQQDVAIDHTQTVRELLPAGP